MTLEDLLAHFTTDKTALLFFFMLLPIATFILTTISSGRSLEPPFSYMYSVVIFIACVPAVLSLTLWVYAMLFEDMALWHLPFFVYYLPIIVLVGCVYLVKKNEVSIQTLPWSGELYELLILIVISFASILIIMKLEILNFESLWQVLLFFALWLGLFYFGWKRFKEIMR